MPLRIGLHIIPLLIALMEYLSVTTSLKIAQTMGDYTTVDLLGGVLRIGDNIAYNSVPTYLILIHILSFLLALFYFYRVTLHGLGENSFTPGGERVAMWHWDDE